MATQAQSKVAVVTGGGSGMGAACARRLAADGFSVAILSSSGKGEALATELGGIGVTGSNQSNDDLKRLVGAVMAKCPKPWRQVMRQFSFRVSPVPVRS